jgi:hypothetical protein
MIFMAITFDLVLSGNRHSAACEHRCTEDDRAYRVFIFGNTASLVKVRHQIKIRRNIPEGETRRHKKSSSYSPYRAGGLTKSEIVPQLVLLRGQM